MTILWRLIKKRLDRSGRITDEDEDEDKEEEQEAINIEDLENPKYKWAVEKIKGNQES